MLGSRGDLGLEAIRLTVFTSPPPSGILGDGQQIDLVMEPVSSKPALRWGGVPSLCG